MSVQEKLIPFISQRDIVIATTDGYSIGFKAGVPSNVPNVKGVLEAVRAAGCVPFDSEGKRVTGKIDSVEDGLDAAVAARTEAIQAAIFVIVERDNPVDFNRAGAPQTRSLEQISGLEKITNAERDEAWKQYKASKSE